MIYIACVIHTVLYALLLALSLFCTVLFVYVELLLRLHIDLQLVNHTSLCSVQTTTKPPSTIVPHCKQYVQCMVCLLNTIPERYPLSLSPINLTERYSFAFLSIAFIYWLTLQQVGSSYDSVNPDSHTLRNHKISWDSSTKFD